MRLGIHLPQYGRAVSAAEIATVATLAEAEGVDDLWVSDHVIARTGSRRPPELFHDPLTVLTWAAARTTRIGLGTSVLVAPYRRPVVLARAIASLDALSRGRVILGLGSGWQQGEFAALGVPFSERGARTDETIAVCRALWRGERSFSGRFTSFDDMTLQPGPHRAGGPPVWIGGVSRAGARRAARLGDAWHLTFSDPIGLEHALTLLDRELVAAGRGRADIEVSVRVRMDPADARGLLPLLTRLGVAHLLADLSRSRPDDLPAQIRELRAATRGAAPEVGAPP
jgi:probable F420-dependent oxidoreductase